MKTLSTFAALSLSISVLAACGPKSAPAEPASDAARPDVHTWTSGAEGFHTHSHWVDTGAEVVVFDAQFTPELAEALVADIQAQTDHPITTVVVTHPNPDKFNGAPVFQALGAEVVASQATADALAEVHAYKKAYFTGVGMFTDETYPALPALDRVFEGSLVLDTAVPVRLVELSHGGVTTTQTVALMGDAVFVGDLVAGRAHAWLEGGIVDGAATPDLGAWDAALDEVLELAAPDAILYPGRGEALPVIDAVEEQQAYLETADAVVSSYVGDLEAPLDALAGPDGGSHFAAMGAAMGEAYPEHAWVDLVTYGVYGLAFARASE